jgi:hypothetical protein
MSDTLFPDYPGADTPTKSRPICCDTWMAFIERYPEPAPVYEVIHAFGHSRVPFTLDALAERADTTLKGAEGAV